MTEVIGQNTSRSISQEQVNAAVAMDSLTIVTGGPGSGKTSVLCGHIKNLVTPREYHPAHCDPNQIIAITFTNRASNEIRFRMHRNDPTAKWNEARGSEHGFIGTHVAFLLWLCNSFLRQLNFFNSVHRLKWIKNEGASKDLNLLRAQALKMVDEQALGIFETVTDKTIETKTQELWRQRRREEGIVTTADLVELTHQILKMPELYAKIEQAGFYLSIDEAQDLGPEEHAIYDKFPARQKYIVGDPAQSVFRFQDQGNSLLNRFMKKPGVRIINLRENYRSFQPICTAAYQLIREHRPDLGVTQQMSMRTASDPSAPMVLSWRTRDLTDQMTYLIKLLRHYCQVGREYYWNQAALIYLEDSQGRQLEGLLRTGNIRCRQEDANNYIRRDTVRAAPELNAVTLVKAIIVKGTEYPNVFIPFCTDTLWPGNNDPNHMRRMLYCAMTRAENTVHFLYHEENYRNEPVLGSTRYHQKVEGSPFLKEMNEPHFVLHERNTLDNGED